MDYTHLLNELNQASTFDLYRLYAAIRRLLENPDRISKIKQRLKKGMEITYFNQVENKLLKAILLELRQKNVVILDENKKPLAIPYYMINIDQIDTEIHPSKSNESLNPNALKVGDCVGFEKDGKTIVGWVKRINQKTVSLETKDGQYWRVAYSFLHRIHDIEYQQVPEKVTIEKEQPKTTILPKGIKKSAVFIIKEVEKRLREQNIPFKEIRIKPGKEHFVVNVNTPYGSRFIRFGKVCLTDYNNSETQLVNDFLIGELIRKIEALRNT